MRTPSTTPHPATHSSVMATVFSGVWPPLLIAALVALALLPRDYDASVPVTALLPLLALHRWTTAARPALTAPFAILAGVSMDVLSAAPLGYWALLDLAAVALAASSAHALRHGTLPHVLLVAAHLAAIFLLQGALMFACTLSLPDIPALVRQSVGALLLYPLIVLLLPLPAQRPRLVDGAWR